MSRQVDLRLAHNVINMSLAGMNLNSRLLKTKERRAAIRKFIFNAVQELRNNPSYRERSSKDLISARTLSEFSK